MAFFVSPYMAFNAYTIVVRSLGIMSFLLSGKTI